MATVDLGDLTREQMDLLARAVDTQEKMKVAMLRLDAEQAVHQRAVFDALMAGVPARLAAEELGLSVARIYQMKHVVSDQT